MNRQDDTENYLHKRAIPTQTLALSQNYPASQPQASRALPGAPSPAAPVRTNVLNFRNGAAQVLEIPNVRADYRSPAPVDAGGQRAEDCGCHPHDRPVAGAAADGDAVDRLRCELRSAGDTRAQPWSEQP